MHAYLDEVREAVAEGMAFARRAWRRVGLIQAIAALGVAMLFVSVRAPLMPADADGLSRLGLVVTLAAWAPLWAGLHRLALGGSAAWRVWPGGLQFGRTEIQFLALGAAVFLAVVLTLLPLVAISAGVFLVFHGLGQVALGPFGGVQVSFLVAAVVWLGAFGGLAYAAARLAFAPAATVSRRKLVIAEAWRLTEGRTGTVATAWLLAQIPILACVGLLVLADRLELQDRLASSSRWPMPDAFVAGAILGLATAFVQAPLTAGVLGWLYRRQRAERARLAAMVRPAQVEPTIPSARLEAALKSRHPASRPFLPLQGAISGSVQTLDQGV